MPRYDVPVEVRQRGAIGIFMVYHFVVDAPTPDDARRKAFDDAQAGGWETRGVMTPREVPAPPTE